MFAKSEGSPATHPTIEREGDMPTTTSQPTGHPAAQRMQEKNVSSGSGKEDDVPSELPSARGEGDIPEGNDAEEERLRREKIRRKIEGFKERITANLLRNYPDTDPERISQAIDLACELHGNQLRKSGNPFIYHPLSVAEFVSEDLDEKAVLMAIFHDAIEDTNISREELARQFGDIADGVEGLTKIRNLDPREKKKNLLETYHKIFAHAAQAQDFRAMIVKLYDRLHNLSELQYLPPHKQQRISRESLEIYAPIAKRLGLNDLHRRLVDTALSFYFAKRAVLVRQQIEKARRKLEPQALQRLARLRGCFERSPLEAKVEVVWHDSLGDYYVPGPGNMGKLEFGNHDDLAMYRVIVPDVLSVYTALGVLHTNFRALPTKFKDYISTPKANGEQRLLTTLFIEREKPIQVEIVTPEMLERNCKGILLQWKKDSGDLSTFYKNYLRLVEIMVENDEVMELEDVKRSVIPDEITVLSPKGEPFTFPKGATCLDFAYRIHTTEVGPRCSGAIINGERKPIDTLLQDGDTVEILTSPHVKPREIWLDYTVTTRAHLWIRKSLKQQRRQRAVEVGRLFFEQALAPYKLSLDAVLRHEGFRRYLETKGLSEEAFFEQFGFRHITAKEVLRQSGLVSAREVRDGGQGRFFGRLLAKRPVFRIRDINDVFVRYAKCCNPLPGDPIVGYHKPGGCITVHRENCTDLLKLKEEGKIDVSWNIEKKIHAPQLFVITEDKEGMLHQVSKAVSSHHVNISDLKVKIEKGKGFFRLKLDLDSLDLLKRIVEKVRRIDGVLEVDVRLEKEALPPKKMDPVR